ncbi:hypothetical protein RM519_12630 [Urechidicola sp. P050]|uniref:Uncharacterized protein n=2 Tax=Urechidicola vernalis TaxID=3075600 RepID=A0ABU2YAK4_9FLAO|nr:hypothetical protein [Urechidicola sp. P050]MDT0554098.1 hypothetical protein [Urechidicola sp. P050]
MQNKTGKYFKYAIGEIVLVVIGILIALQINNWNSHRINTNRNHVLLKKLSKELDLNIDRSSILDIGGKYVGLEERYIYADSVSKLLDKNKVSNNLDYVIREYIFFVIHFNINTAVYEELKNTGSLYSLASDNLVTEIQRYYQLCERESFYNLEYSKDVITLRDKCFDGWYDFVYWHKKNPEEAFKRHPWINNPTSNEYIEFRQFIEAVRWHSELISNKLKGIIQESEELKKLISSELNVL